MPILSKSDKINLAMLKLNFKFKSFIIVFLLGLTFFPTKALATIDQEDLKKDASPNVGNYYNNAVLPATFASLTCQIGGAAMCPELADNDNDQGLLPVEVKYLSDMMINRPASTGQYLAHLMKNIGLPVPTSVYAQGTGYRMFSPVIQLWQVFRDLAYTLYILIFLVIGFMIMFRTKINAQTVISIQAALPNLIITLLLITFSYAIAGFLVDIMYFLIYFLVYLAGSKGLINAPATMSYFLKHNLIGIFFPIGQTDVIMNNISKAVDNFFFALIGHMHSAGGIGSWLVKLFLIFAVSLQLLKLLFGLLKSYLMVIIHIITAPLQLLPNAIPGSKAFSTWLKNIAANLAPFPILTALFVLAIILAVPGQTNAGPSKDNPFGVQTNLFSQHNTLGTFPYIAGVSTTAQDLSSLLALALILMSPAVVKMSQDFFKVKESPYASEVMAGLKSGFLPFNMARGWLQQRKQNLNQKRMINAMENRGSNPKSQ